MWSKKHGNLLVVSQHFRGLVEILIVTFIAPDPEAALEIRPRRVDIRFAKRNCMLREKILSIVIPIVLAEYHPVVAVIFPHANLLQAISRIGPAFSSVNFIKLQGYDFEIDLPIIVSRQPLLFALYVSFLISVP